MSLNEFLLKNCLEFRDNIHFFDQNRVNKFNQQYITLREKEHRIYDEKIIRMLPSYTGENKLLAREWVMRKISSQKLKDYLSVHFSNKNFLEIGCGNGWLCNYLGLISSVVYGLDINYIELMQAAKLFYQKDKIEFIFGDIFQLNFPLSSFDVIIFASSIQYFSDFNKLIKVCQNILKSNGEIHILDSHFYTIDKLLSAKQRSSEYYDSLGIPEMKDFYFHHSFDELDDFNHEFLYNPYSNDKNFVQKLFNNEKNPFPWIKITME